MSELNKYSKVVTQDPTQPAAQAMFHGIGLSDEDLKSSIRHRFGNQSPLRNFINWSSGLYLTALLFTGFIFSRAVSFSAK